MPAIRSTLSLGVSCLLAACASSGPGFSSTISDLDCTPGDLEVAWSGSSSGLYHPAFLDLAPGGALLSLRASMGGDMVRMRDGASLDRTDMGALDETWTRSIIVDGDTGLATLSEVPSGAVLRTIARTPAAPGYFGSTHAWLAGGRALLLDCPATAELDATWRTVDLTTGAETSRALPIACGLEGTDLLALGESAVLLVGVHALGATDVERAPGLLRVDLASGEAISAFPIDPTRAPALVASTLGFDPPHAVVSVATSPSEIALVGRDGLVHRLDAITLEPIADPFAVPLFVANPNTYLPSVASPVAYSAGGRYLAHVADLSTVVIRELSSGEIVATLALGFGPGPEGDVPAAMALRFVNDGSIAVGSTATARFACGGMVAPIARPSGELAGHATGPSNLRTGLAAMFRVDVENATLPVYHRVRIGDSSSSFGSVSADVQLSPWTAGSFELEAIADDGVREARASLPVSVVTSP